MGAAGINNLVTAFIDGGARSVVSTLWELEDHSTTRLMTNFYANLKTESKAQALRDAQIELLRLVSVPTSGQASSWSAIPTI